MQKLLQMKINAEEALVVITRSIYRHSKIHLHLPWEYWCMWYSVQAEIVSFSQGPKAVNIIGALSLFPSLPSIFNSPSIPLKQILGL